MMCWASLGRREQEVERNKYGCQGFYRTGRQISTAQGLGSS